MRAAEPRGCYDIAKRNLFCAGGFCPLRRRKFLQLSLTSLGALAISPDNPQTASQVLRGVASAKSLLAGAAFSLAQLQRAELASLLAAQCSVVVAENKLKWRQIHPERDRYDFAQADAMLAFAEAPITADAFAASGSSISNTRLAFDCGIPVRYVRDAVNSVDRRLGSSFTSFQRRTRSCEAAGHCGNSN